MSTPPRKPVDPMVGVLLDGKYRIESTLGTGATGKVYQAIQESIGRKVAVKMLRPDLEEDAFEIFEQRFLREAALAGSLQHPNIVTVHDFGRADDLVYMVMELIDGPSLKGMIRQGPMAPLRVLTIGEQVARGLRHAHAAGLVHRDVKPGNILVLQDEDGGDYVKILDFGLVKAEDDTAITQAGSFLGTPHYIAPEQARGVEATARSDIYSFGVMLYRMLTGKLPYDAATTMGLALAHIRDPYPPMAERAPEAPVSPEIEHIVRQCMAKDPDERYPDAGALLDELVKVRKRLFPEGLSNEETSALGLSPFLEEEPPPPTQKIAERGLAGLVGAILALLLAVGVLGGVWVGLEMLGSPGSGDVEAAPEDLSSEMAALAEPTLPDEPPPPREVHVLISSDPSGADVTLDGVSLGTTPLARKVTIRADDPDPTRTFELTLEGYQPGSLELDLSLDQAAANATLEPVPRPRVVQKAAPMEASASPVTADGVQFTGAQSARALKLLNEGSDADIRAAGIATRQLNIIKENRPFASVQAFAATPYIGEKTVQALQQAVAQE